MAIDLTDASHISPIAEAVCKGAMAIDPWFAPRADPCRFSKNARRADISSRITWISVRCISGSIPSAQFQVKRISGHKTLVMVERYAHQSGAHIQAAMDKLEERYSKKTA